MDNAQPIM